MANDKAYPEYKDSGVEWLGEVPNHWKTLSISRLFSRIKRTGYTEKELLSVYRDYGVIPKSSRDDNNNKPSEDLSPYQLVEPNDLVMNKMKAWQGSIAISEYEGIVSPAYFVYKPNNVLFELAYPRYVHYLLRNPIYVTQYLSRSKGIRVNQWDLDPDEFRNIELLLPDKSEQEKIYSFLDHETAKIDNLIEKQKQLIELLKEKRQAVISHAVTKGLNPDVTMKDSGVEWLGEVPEHWEVKRIKHFGKVIGGFAFKSTDFTDEGYPVIKISNVSHLSFDWGDSSFLPPSFSFTHKEYLAPNGALVFAMTRPVISGGIKITLLDDDSAPLVNQRVGFMMVKSKNMARYILISTQSSAFLAQFVNNMTVTNQPNISSDGIESIYLPVPPMSEISRILLYVDRMNESYNQLIDKALLQVSLLQERRTALISAAVTGKIDVRGWVAPDTQDVEEPQEATA